MPLPILFIGAAAAASGMFGAGKTVKAITDNSKAGNIIKIANQEVEAARDTLEQKRLEVRDSFDNLGKLKLAVLEHNVIDFVNTFEKIKNVDFTDSVGIDELKNLHLDAASFKELKELGNFAANVAGGAAAGAVGGAMTAFGAYSAAMTFATASTGTAISTLSGAAATNATLAFFGGGSLAAGGLGMAGGIAVLSSLVAGPALAVMGLITDAKAQEKVNKALENKAEADAVVESLNAASYQCTAIRRRTYMFYTMLAHLDAQFLPLVWKMQHIVETEGTDYRQYSKDSKKIVASAAATACSIKAILDTPILNEEGELTEASAKLIETTGEKIYA